jgi:hypothetical protein
VSSFLSLFGSAKTPAGTGDTAMGSAAGVLGAVDSQAANVNAAAQTALAASATTTEGALIALTSAATSAASALAAIAGSSAGSSAGGLAGLFGGGASGAVDNGSVNLFADAAPGLAAGGRALPGKLYPVNERGPEVLDVNGKQYLMTGRGRANVTPVSGGGDAPGQRPIQVIQYFPSGTSKVAADQAAARAGQVVRKALARG